MLKTFVTATAIGGLMLSTALAQAPQPQQPGTPPAKSTPSTPSATPAPKTDTKAGTKTNDQAKAGGPQFVASQSSDQMLMSKFDGTDVIGPDNKKIGDVTDILFDKSGKIVAVVVGVGGFLGIGQKDVAIDMSAFQVVPASTGSSANTGSTSSSANDPNDVKLKVSWTKDQLKAAPSFEAYKSPAKTTSRPAPSRPTGGGAAR